MKEDQAERALATIHASLTRSLEQGHMERGAYALAMEFLEVALYPLDELEDEDD